MPRLTPRRSSEGLLYSGDRHIRNELEIDGPSQRISVNGILRQMQMVKIDAHQTKRPVELIVAGLHFHHYGEALTRGDQLGAAGVGAGRTGA